MVHGHDYSAMIERAKATFSGSGYAIASPTFGTTQKGWYGPCPWCGSELDGKGQLAHLENGFDQETLDPTYAPATIVCAGCHEQARQWGRLRV